MLVQRLGFREGRAERDLRIHLNLSPDFTEEEGNWSTDRVRCYLFGAASDAILNFMR